MESPFGTKLGNQNQLLTLLEPLCSDGSRLMFVHMYIILLGTVKINAALQIIRVYDIRGLLSLYVNNY